LKHKKTEEVNASEKAPVEEQKSAATEVIDNPTAIRFTFLNAEQYACLPKSVYTTNNQVIDG